MVYNLFFHESILHLHCYNKFYSSVHIHLKQDQLLKINKKQFQFHLSQPTHNHKQTPRRLINEHRTVQNEKKKLKK